MRSRHPLYHTWTSMLDRCENPNAKDYYRYGGRGITVSNDWHEFDAFAFDMGERPAGCSLDRIDNDGPYSKSNCRWATGSEQQANSSRAKLLTYDGQTRTLRDWARIVSGNPNYNGRGLRISLLKHGVAKVIELRSKRAPYGSVDRRGLHSKSAASP